MTPAAGRASVTVTLSADALLTSNQRLHWKAAAPRTAKIKRAFTDAAQDTPHLTTPVHVDVHLTFNRGHRRDATNWHPTIKAATDGLVGAGVIEDDSDRHLTSTTFHAHTVDPELPPKHVRVTLTLTEVSNAA